MDWEQLTEEPALLGEGPCWHAGEQVLYWVDILGCALHRFDPVSGEDKQWAIGERIGTVAPRWGGSLVLGLERGFAFFWPKSGKLERMTEIEPGGRTRFNDGYCDPQGRFWCGSMDLEEREGVGALYRMDEEGKVTKQVEGVTVSNGMGWSPDGKTMYYIDSPTRQVVAYDFDPASGDISRRRVVITLAEGEGFPDGMTVDTEGKIWLALWGGASVARYDPASGKRLASHATTAWQTSACCFGGAAMNELYVTSARVNLSEEQQRAYPGSGHLFRARLPFTGLPTHTYQG